MNDVKLCTAADDSYAKTVKLNEEDQLLLSFAEYRGRIMKKWPVITTSRPSAVSAGNVEELDPNCNF